MQQTPKIRRTVSSAATIRLQKNKEIRRKCDKYNALKPKVLGASLLDPTKIIQISATFTNAASVLNDQKLLTAALHRIFNREVVVHEAEQLTGAPNGWLPL